MAPSRTPAGISADSRSPPASRCTASTQRFASSCTETAVAFPKVTRGCRTSTRSISANSVRRSVSIARGRPIAATSRGPSTASAGSTRYCFFGSSVAKGRRCVPSCASTTTMTASFSHAAAKFGGRMTCSEQGSPSVSENITNSGSRGFSITGAATTFGGASTASPTAMECAQMRPQRRDSMQVQVFSISVFDLIRRPERNSVSAPRTRPTNSGGS